jgi:hypothetical protein
MDERTLRREGGLQPACHVREGPSGQNDKQILPAGRMGPPMARRAYSLLAAFFMAFW